MLMWSFSLASEGECFLYEADCGAVVGGTTSFFFG